MGKKVGLKEMDEKSDSDSDCSFAFLKKDNTELDYQSVHEWNQKNDEKEANRKGYRDDNQFFES